MADDPIVLWVIFSAVIAAMLYIDLGVVNRHALTANRLAQQDVAKTRAASRGAVAPRTLQEAALSQSSAALQARHYEEAIAAATEAIRWSQASLAEQSRDPD